MSAANPVTLPLSGYQGRHVGFAVDGKVATLTLNRSDKKNPLTFDSYAEIVDLFRAAARDKVVKAIVVTGSGGNFCSGGDVFEIIEPLTKMSTVELLDFTTSPVMRVKSSSSTVLILVSGSMISNTSPPEQKLPPLPVTTMALIPLSLAAARNRSTISA